MIKVTIDTNVLISGTFWTGDSFRILELVDQKIVENIISKEIIDEYLKVISSEEILNKTKENNLRALSSIEKIKMNSKIVFPKRRFNASKKDPADNKIIETAFEGKADFIITQDNHLLKIKNFKGIILLKPNEFLNRL